MFDFDLGYFVSNRIERKQIQNEIVEKDFDETFEFLQGTKRKFYILIIYYRYSNFNIIDVWLEKVKITNAISCLAGLSLLAAGGGGSV